MSRNVHIKIKKIIITPHKESLGRLCHNILDAATKRYFFYKKITQKLSKIGRILSIVQAMASPVFLFSSLASETRHECVNLL